MLLAGMYITEPWRKQDRDFWEKKIQKQACNMIQQSHCWDINMLHQGYLLTTDQIWNPTPCSAAGERSRFNKECDPSIGSSVHTTLGQHTECAKPDLREKHQTSLLTPGTSKIRTEIKNTHLYLGQAHGQSAQFQCPEVPVNLLCAAEMINLSSFWLYFINVVYVPPGAFLLFIC